MPHHRPEELQGKYTWTQVDRVEPPKRSVVDRVSDFFEIYGDYDEATAREQASRCLQCPNPSCVNSCPVGDRIPDWLALTAEGRFLEAAAVCEDGNNLPEICARLCPRDRLCEGACIINGKAESVSIGALERFITEYAFKAHAIHSAPVPANGGKVAIVGSGPGGLACADELAKLGYAVTVFEARPVPGGLLIGGVPAYKIAQSVVDRRIEVLKQRGVQFKLGVAIGRDLMLRDLQAEFDAVFLGVGAQKARPLEVPGAELSGVCQALTFLMRGAADAPIEMPHLDARGKRVVVLGCGDTAMDCLRTSIRSGASETVCIYRRDADNMPAARREFNDAIEEGAKFCFLAMPTAILGDEQGKVTMVRCAATELGECGADGRRLPHLIPGTEFERPADIVVVAFGFDPVPFPEDSDLGRIGTNRWGGVQVDASQMTNIPGVFAGGDLVRGPSLVVYAVRDARRAARQIHHYVSSRKQ
jgi:glutamate synthase (NADPH/NADH) small chain